VIAIPAIDLREGACVQLIGGDYSAERVRLSDPLAVLRGWEECGFTRAHIVDLDAATGRGSNSGIVRQIAEGATIELQVGGGVRSDERVRDLFALGARFVVVGTRALEDPVWLEKIALNAPHGVIVAVDVRGRDVVCAGWMRSLSRNVADVLTELNALPLAGILVTAVHVEGQMRGPDLALAEVVAETSRAPAFAAGGIGSLSDLAALAERGIAGAIIGMALYTGALDPRAVAQEFAA
jgi:phosphoribosylformimino-5-aminoimidazole carboxamide ribotide isomerase